MDKQEQYLSVIGVMICAVFYLLNIYFSTGIYDLNDGLAHYTIARYAPVHPELYLDHWGKPLFTLFASPFTGLGIKGVMLMNTLLYVATSWILLKISQLLKLEFGWAAPVLLAFMPVYFATVMGGLTEVLFAMVLLAGLFAFGKERFLQAAFIISWLPFARSEGYLILPLFALAFALKKQLWPIVMLGFALVLMSIVGGFVLGDFYWVIHNNPYVGAADIYGAGHLWHFAKHAGAILGWSNAFLLLGGALFFVATTKRNFLETKNLMLALSVTSVLVVFFAHSIFWANGLYGSLGLLRVMAVVLPPTVLIIVYFFQQLGQRIHPYFTKTLVLLCIGFTVISLWFYQPIYKQPEAQEALVKELAVWYDSSAYAGNSNVWFMYPPVGYYLGIDVYNSLHSRQLWFLNWITPSNSIRNGGLIIYDGARAPNEGITSKEKLLADPHLNLVHRIAPDTEMLDMNDSPFEFLVFEKKLNLKTDTLIDESFMASRPILEERLNKIGTDSLGRRYFSLLNQTHYMHVFTFWKSDRKDWDAAKHEIAYHASERLEVYLSVVHEDGTEDDIKWHHGVFELPPFDDDVVNISVSLRNPHPNKEIRVYRWVVRKVED